VYAIPPELHAIFIFGVFRRGFNRFDDHEADNIAPW
jgi:hypothetical protein